MAEQIEQERLFDSNLNNQRESSLATKIPESGKEIDYGVKRLIFSSETEVFLKDQNSGRITGYKIPDKKEIQILFLGKINKEDEKTSCTVIEFFRETEEGDRTNDLRGLKIEGKEPAFIKRGTRIFLHSNDLIKQLDLELQKEDAEKKRIAQEKKDSENVKSDHFKKIGIDWGKRYRDPTHVKGADD